MRGGQAVSSSPTIDERRRADRREAREQHRARRPGADRVMDVARRERSESLCPRLHRGWISARKLAPKSERRVARRHALLQAEETRRGRDQEIERAIAGGRSERRRSHEDQAENAIRPRQRELHRRTRTYRYAHHDSSRCARCIHDGGEIAGEIARRELSGHATALPMTAQIDRDCTAMPADERRHGAVDGSIDEHVVSEHDDLVALPLHFVSDAHPVSLDARHARIFAAFRGGRHLRVRGFELRFAGTGGLASGFAGSSLARAALGIARQSTRLLRRLSG